MCGIAGWISARRNMRNEKDVLEGMCATLAHRGPDSSGFYLSEQAALGHKRLAVIDPAGGLQPMTVKSRGNWTIVYNGELYNTEELRNELLSLGHRFNTSSDTEVLLASVIEWGKDSIRRLNGIFAFAVWDEVSGTLLAARDPLGVKPLFYCELTGELLFASELKALLAHPAVEPILAEKGLLELFGLGPARSPDSGIFQGLKEVPPGNFLTWRNGILNLESYWQLQARPHTDSLEDTIEKVRFLVTDAIKRQLVSDVPLCTFLSGGLDSSAISAVAARELSELHTWSLDYQGNKRWFKQNSYQPSDDSQWIEVMREYLDSSHHNVIITADQLCQALKDSVLANDLPGMADIDSSLLLFARSVREQATVALSGECADEIFGGYPWYWQPELQNLDTFPWSNSLDLRRRLLSQTLKALPLEEYVRDAYQETITKVPTLPGEPESETRLRRLYALNLRWFMLTLLNRKDRMSMANSLEVRVPFADHRIVEYAFNIPWPMKHLNNREKGLLRAALTDTLPQAIIERKKSPWPKTHNPAYLDLVRQKLKDILADSHAPLWQLVDINFVQGLANSGGDILSTPWFGQLMTGPQLMAWLVQIDTWLHEYKITLRI